MANGSSDWHRLQAGILVFMNGLGLGGTEKAVRRWACGLWERGHQMYVLTLADGPRCAELERHGIPVWIAENEPIGLAAAVRGYFP